MTKVTMDSSTLAKLHDLGEVLEVSDESGRVLGYFHPVGAEPASTLRSPFTDEEIKDRRQQCSGLPLSVILEQLPPA